jgi:hypothetical protein
MSLRQRGRVLAALIVVAATAIAPSAAAGTSRPAHSHPIRFVVTGQVAHRHAYTVSGLRSFPQHTVTVSFSSGQGLEHHTYTGPLLLDVAAAGPRFDASVKNDPLRFFLAATGSDGYRAIVAWGEIDPGFAGNTVLLAVSEDGNPLDTVGPRLVVPGDAKGGRYVSGIAQIYIGDTDRLISRN